MGFSLDETLNMSWQEFEFNSVGYQRRIERNWDYTRHLVANMYNSSGFSKKAVSASEIMKLPMLDNGVKKPAKKMDKETLERMKKQLQ